MSDPIDVLVVTQFFPPESMGGAHRWEKIAANLDEGVNPHILTTQPTFPFGEFERQWRPIQQKRVNEILVTRLFTWQPKSDTTFGRVFNYGVFSVLSSMYVLCTFLRYDCIVTMSAPHTTFLPGIMGHLTGCVWIIDIFDLWIDNAADLGYVDEGALAHRLVSRLEETAFSCADAVFVITETMGEHYREKYPELHFEVHLVPFGVDRELFSPNVQQKASTDLIYTGNLGTGQAFEPFIEGFARLSGEWELTIVGDGERRGELEELVAERGIGDRVSFEGYVPREEIPGLLSGAKVSLVPLKTEYKLDYARPTKLLESMATGTPYVASAVREISLVSNRERTGIACENNPREIHNSLNRLLDEDSLRYEMGANGTSFITECHDWQNIGSATSDTLRELTA